MTTFNPNLVKAASPVSEAPTGSTETLAQEWMYARSGEHFCIRIPASATAGAYSVTEIAASPGDSTPVHMHAKEDEVIHVIEGTVTLLYGDRQFESGPGTVIKLDRGIPHAWGNATSEPIRLLITATPGGCEEALRLIASAGEDVDLMEIAMRFEVTPLGPPLLQR